MRFGLLSQENDYSSIHHQLTGLYNDHRLCSLWGMNWTSVYYADYLLGATLFFPLSVFLRMLHSHAHLHVILKRRTSGQSLATLKQSSALLDIENSGNKINFNLFLSIQKGRQNYERHFLSFSAELRVLLLYYFPFFLAFLQHFFLLKLFHFVPHFSPPLHPILFPLFLHPFFHLFASFL